MKLNLTKPLVVFDLETTGLDIVRDNIIQISYIKIWPDGNEERKSMFVKPSKPIPPEVVELTHITNEQVADAPTFKEIAPQLCQDFSGCDFAGFNSNHFDVPMLAEEFIRAGVDFDFSKSRLIDVQTIFHRMEPRNLAAAYKFYTGRKMSDDFQAHLADQDAEATYAVLKGQLDRYAPGVQDEDDKVLHNDMDELASLSKLNDNVDFAGRIVWKDKTDSKGKPIMGVDGKPQKHEVFNFGKYKGKPVVDVMRMDQGYYGWIMNGDFSSNTKQVLTRIRLRELSRQKQ